MLSIRRVFVGTFVVILAFLPVVGIALTGESLIPIAVAQTTVTAPGIAGKTEGSLYVGMAYVGVDRVEHLGMVVTNDDPHQLVIVKSTEKNQFSGETNGRYSAAKPVQAFFLSGDEKVDDMKIELYRKNACNEIKACSIMFITATPGGLDIQHQ